MSALQQLMSGYSRDIQALSQHAADHDEEVADRKAGDLNEQFANYIDHIEAGAQDLGSAAAAWHLGRKIYTKYQERKAARAKPGQSGEEDNRSEAQKDAADDAAGGDAGDETTATAQGAASDPISTEDSFFPDRPTAAGEEDPFDGPVSRSAKTAGEEQMGKAPEDPIESEGTFFPDQAAGAAAEDDPFGGPVAQRVAAGKQSASTGADVDTQPQAAPQPVEEIQPQPTTTTTVQADPGSRTTQGEFGGQTADPEGEFADEPAGGAQQGVSLKSQRIKTAQPAQGDQGSPGSQVNRPTPGSEVDTGGAELGDESESLTSKLGTGIKNLVGGAKGAIGDAIEQTGNMAKQAATKVGSTLKNLLPDSVGDALDTGLITTDAVLDGIPVVGEVASVITGLVALFEGIGNKPKTAEDEAAVATKQAPGTAVTAIDPSTLVKQQAVNLVA